jgi:heme-degrading monooxygenase HmoA
MEVSLIVEYIRYAIPDSRRHAFERGYAEAEAALVASPNCLGFELARCTEDPARYTLRIEWDSPEGHLHGFRKSSEFRTFFAAVRTSAVLQMP